MSDFIMNILRFPNGGAPVFDSLAPLGTFWSLARSPFRSRRSDIGNQLAHSKQVVCGSDHKSVVLRSFDSPESCFPESANRLEPTEYLFHPLADSFWPRMASPY